MADVRIGWWARLLRQAEHHGNRRLRPVGTWLFRITGGRIGPAGREIVLLTTRGRRTGRVHTVLLQAFRDGDDMVLVAANAGRGTLPDWYRNLLAAGSAVVEEGGKRRTVRPIEIDPAAARRLWPGILEKAPTYARYVALAGRELPLVRLVPIKPDASRKAQRSSATCPAVRVRQAVAILQRWRSLWYLGEIRRA